MFSPTPGTLRRRLLSRYHQSVLALLLVTAARATTKLLRGARGGHTTTEVWEPQFRLDTSGRSCRTRQRVGDDVEEDPRGADARFTATTNQIGQILGHLRTREEEDGTRHQHLGRDSRNNDDDNGHNNDPGPARGGGRCNDDSESDFEFTLSGKRTNRGSQLPYSVEQTHPPAMSVVSEHVSETPQVAQLGPVSCWSG